MTRDITVQIASDFVCPWCIVGHARLEQALEQSGLKDRVKIEFLPYELNPSAPEEGFDRKAHLAKKFGGPEKLEELDSRMRAIGLEDGIKFRQDLMKRTPNTFKAHRLTWLASQKYPEKVAALAHRILEAYFTEGQDIGDAATLAKLAGETGIDQKEVMDFLLSDKGTKEVRKLEDEARVRGVNVVPYFTIGDEDIRGAHAADVYVEALQNAAGRKAA